MADAADLKSAVRKGVRVQIPPSAPKLYATCGYDPRMRITPAEKIVAGVLYARNAETRSAAARWSVSSLRACDLSPDARPGIMLVQG